MAKTKGWLEPSFLSEVITGTVLALWILFTELTKLDVYFSVAIGVIFYIVFLLSLLYRKHASDKLQLDTLRAQLRSEESKTFTDKVQAPSVSRFAESQGIKNTLNKAIRMLEETVKDEKLPQNKKDTYEEIIRRLKDFARPYSPF